MKMNYWIGLLLAVPLAHAQELQRSPATSAANETLSPKAFEDLVTHIPPCALACLERLVRDTPCSFTDLPCMCSNDELKDAVTTCVKSSCLMSEALTTMNLTQTACGQPIRDISGQYTSMSIVSGVFTILLVIARLLFKQFISGSGQIGADDWIIFAAVVIAVPGIVVNQVGLVGHGIGKDIWTLPARELPTFAKFFFVMEVIYIVQISLVKLSLSLFYLHVFQGPNIRRLLIGTAVFNAVFGVVFVSASMAQCRPLHFYWSQYYDHPSKGTCFDLDKFAWANAGLGLAVDVWMIIIPIVQVRRLNLHWKKKCGVVAMLILGTFVSIISLLRLRSVVFFAKLINPTWDQWNVAWWSTMEVNIGIICTCLPTVRLMLKRMFPNILYTGDEHSNNTDVSGRSSAFSRGKPQKPAFPMELSTATLVSDSQSSLHKPFNN